MTPQINRVAAVTLVLFGALFVNLNVITLLQANDLANHPANRRLIIREYAIERGPIVVGEDAIAFSEVTDGELRFQRRYPEPELYGHLTGYFSILLQRSGLEDALNEDLTGRPTEVLAQNLGELLGGAERPGNAVELTIDAAVQRAARDALGSREGAIVAMDPTTGAVLASYANPTFDPNPLSSHDRTEINQAWEALLEDPSQPLVDRALRQTYPPGSTFKVITAAAALEHGLEPETAFPDDTVYDVPQTTADIGNYGGGVCLQGDTISLRDALRVSCNTTFARLGVELGADALVEQAARFGFDRPVPLELDVAESSIPDDLDVPASAQSAIGQRDVRATPLQMASVAATIANGGTVLRPHLVAAVHNPDGQLVRSATEGRWADSGYDGQALSPAAAEQLREMMILAVDDGTGRAARIDGVVVGGKTGTAQTGPDSPPVAWFIGFAGDDVAIAVMLPDAGDDATGGAIAAPIAREVMAAALGRD